MASSNSTLARTPSAPMPTTCASWSAPNQPDDAPPVVTITLPHQEQQSCRRTPEAWTSPEAWRSVAKRGRGEAWTCTDHTGSNIA